MGKTRGPLPLFATGAALLALLAAHPAGAITIKPKFDSSITRLSNAAQIESAFNAVASHFDTSLKSKAVIYITVSWGSVGGSALPNGDIGASIDNLYDGFTYADVRSYLDAAAAANPLDKTLALAAKDLPSVNPTKKGDFAFSYADAKALGLLPPTQTLPDGFVGFKAISNYAFTKASMGPGLYDFRAVAAHEIEEVLGRMSALGSGGTSYAMPFDLFRYSSYLHPSFGYDTAAYFSINRGATNLGAFDYSGGGDRGDWGSASLDVQDALLSSGKVMSIGAADFTALDALGWDAAVNPGGFSATTLRSGVEGFSATPEPATWAISICGIALTGAALRRRRAAKTKAPPAWTDGALA
ncbi:MAG TPA: NF038122 family metalloprotease [Caulobacteraceae bacterium]|nr:NF038122 family metalloprotease [Caulobacteraceae bacterium]